MPPGGRPDAPNPVEKILKNDVGFSRPSHLGALVGSTNEPGPS